METNNLNRNDYYRKNRLTKDELRKHEGFENMSDEELERRVLGLLELASVLVEIYLHQQKTRKIID